jgi:hypothetical protein
VHLAWNYMQANDSACALDAARSNSTTQSRTGLRHPPMSF